MSGIKVYAYANEHTPERKMVFPPWAHFMAGFADGMAVFVERDVVRGIFGGFCPAVNVNQRIYVPVFR